MFRNMLTGHQIPSEIGQLINLRTLVMSQNLLTGKRLLNPNFLALQQKSNVGIEGRLPSFSISKLANLTAVYLGPNWLTGTIPESFLSGVSIITQGIEINLSLNVLGNSDK
jgi:LRR receptor-like serine/threonine-protein kinase FLS2